MCFLGPINRITVVCAYWINDLQVQENKKGQVGRNMFYLEKLSIHLCSKPGTKMQNYRTKTRKPTTELSTLRPCFSKYLLWSIFDLKNFLSYWHVWTFISRNVTLMLWIFGMHVCYFQAHVTLVAHRAFHGHWNSRQQNCFLFGEIVNMHRQI